MEGISDICEGSPGPFRSISCSSSAFFRGNVVDTDDVSA